MPEQIYWITGYLAGRLGVMARPRGGDWLDDDLRALHFRNVDMIVSLLTALEIDELDLGAEEATCRAYHMQYRSFPILDRHVPPLTSTTLIAIGQVYAALFADQRIVIHCRMGIGRAATIAASVLALSGVPPDDAFAQITAARRCPVPDTAEQRAWVQQFVTFVQQHQQLGVPTSNTSI